MRKPHIATATYERSHGRKPRGIEYGRWLFRNADTGETVAVTGEYRDAVASLSSDASMYVVQP